MGYAELKITLAAIAKFMRIGGAEPITLSEFEEMTGLSHQAVLDGLAAAMQRGIIDRYEVVGYRGHTSYVYEIRIALAEKSIGLAGRPIEPIVKLVKSQSINSNKELTDSSDSPDLTDSIPSQVEETERIRKQLREAGVYPGSIRYLLSHHSLEHIRAYLEIYPEARGWGWRKAPLAGQCHQRQLEHGANPGRTRARKEAVKTFEPRYTPSTDADEAPAEVIPDWITEAWQKALDVLASEVRQADFDTWARFSRAFAYDDAQNVFQVGVMNSYAAEWLQNRLSIRAGEIMSETLGNPTTVTFAVHYFRGDC
jgi:DNA-binding transcriptional regulator GbsR (MarR family)